MNAHVRIAAVTAAVALLGSTAWAGSSRIQCWTDDQGHRACGNAVQAQYADKERQVLNERGQVVETKSHAPTIEETDPSLNAKPDERGVQGQAQPAAH